MAIFDLTKDELRTMLEDAEYPAIVPFIARASTRVSPLDVYTNLENSSYSYLLESSGKEKRHARFSFVGAAPDAVVVVRERFVDVEIHNQAISGLIAEKLKRVSKNLHESSNRITAELAEGFDTFDGLRAIYNIAHFNGKNIFERQTFLGGMVGYFAYDVVYDCWLKKRVKNRSPTTPDCIFLLSQKTIVFDHLSDEVFIILTPIMHGREDLEESYEKAEKDALELLKTISSSCSTSTGKLNQATTASLHFKCNMEKEEYEIAVEKAKQHIRDGDIFQVVLSRRYDARINCTPLDIYRSLRSINPSPYMYMLKFKELAIVGTSPETLLTVFNRQVINNPIAGTCARGKTSKEDEELARNMLSDKKEVAEHVMLVDLGRNDVRIVSKPGSVKVSSYMSVLKYSHVQHIESTVTGELRDECDAFDATRAIVPMGTVSGAPKIRSMEIIDDLEKEPRGIYAGGIGYYAWDGSADFAITIRTIVVNGSTASVQAGAGIVADSVPEKEYYETERKMRAMLRALEVVT